MDDVDLLVIGGGINGAGIARDASGRGLRVLLCEQHDLAAHTSSASSKLIHGGLRYLEQGEFGLVRKALGEREVVRRQAPHLVHPLRFVLPWEPHLRPRWMLRAGLWLYDHLGRRSPAFPASRALELQHDPLGQWLSPALRQAFSYADAQVDDARLVLLNALDAAQRGAQVQVRSRCIDLHPVQGRWRAVLESADGQRHPVNARAVVNAAGPWAGGLLERMQARSGGPALRLVQGSHIVLRRPWPDDSACLLQQPDGRVVFLLPFAHDHLLVGTTDTDYRGDPARCSVLPSEVTYLCEAANRYLRDPIAPDEVVWAFAGVRPLLADPDPRAAQLSRDYRLQVQVDPAPALHVLGGKLTTYRVLAEEALDLLRPALPQMGPAWTPHRRARACWRWHRGCPQVSRDAGPGPMAVAARNCCRVYTACTIWARTSAVACMHAKWTSCANASGRVTPTISCGAGASWGCAWMLRRWHGCRHGWRVGSLSHGKGSDPRDATCANPGWQLPGQPRATRSMH